MSIPNAIKKEKLGKPEENRSPSGIKRLEIMVLAYSRRKPALDSTVLSSFRSKTFEVNNTVGNASQANFLLSL